MLKAAESKVAGSWPAPQTLVRLALSRLGSNEHFACHTDAINVSYDNGLLVLTGRAPSFYLKSILQIAVGELPAGCRVENRVDVVNCEGLSSS